MNEPLVSVIIPAYDEEAFVAEAIESTLAQTYPRVETIVVDDGSTDRTAEIAAGYEEVKLIRQENRGLSNARNTGVAASNGEILAFLDADDMMLPDRLRVQVGHLLDNPGIGCNLASQETIVEDGAPLPFWARGTETPVFSSPGVMEPTGTPDAYTVTMVFRRRLFDEVGGFDETLVHGGEDADILMRIGEAGVEIAMLKDVVLRRRIHHNNMTQSEGRAKDAIFEVFKRRIDRHREERA